MTAPPPATRAVCPACLGGDHGSCAVTFPTGRQVPDTDPYRDRTRMVAEYATCTCEACEGPA